MEGFDIVESKRSVQTEPKVTVITPKDNQSNVPAKGDKAMDMLADNFGNILNLAGEIVSIKKLQVASEAQLAKMAEDRRRILDEAQAYATKKRADTDSVVERMNVIRSMMQDFYAQSQGNISGEDFCKIITEVVNQMGRVEHGER